MLKWVKSYRIESSQVLFCAENMGVYVSGLAFMLTKQQLSLSLTCPFIIKKSIGIARGISDKIDPIYSSIYIKTSQDIDYLHNFKSKYLTT